MHEKHCREQSLEEEEQLIGTATPHERYLLIEAAFPWTHDVLESKDLTSFRHILEKYDPLKVLCIGYDKEYSRPGLRNILLCIKRERFYEVQHFMVPRGRESIVLPAILEGQADAYNIHEDHRHILVCIDGGHDYCCGRWGQPCYAKLRKELVGAAYVWRCSHIGGHRFAPTAIDFPEGRWYGRLDENASGLFLKKRPFAEIAHMYRGNGCLPKIEQAEEAQTLETEGWC